MRYTTHRTNGFTSHPKDDAMVKCLKDTSVTAGDSNPHSADQKHQSLNSVLLTVRHDLNNYLEFFLTDMLCYTS